MEKLRSALKIRKFSYLKVFLAVLVTLTVVLQLFSCVSRQQKRNSELIVSYDGREVHRSGSKYVSFANFKEIVNNQEKKYILFGAEWCKACKFLYKALKQSGHLEKIAIVNLEEGWTAPIKKNLGITSIPTLIVANKSGNIEAVVKTPSKIVMYLLLYYETKE